MVGIYLAMPAIPPQAKQRVIQTFGLGPYKGFTQTDYHRVAFAYRQPVEKGGLPRFDHFKALADAWFPDGKVIQWNPWTERTIRCLCENNWVGLMGCSSSSKTFATSFYACIWWLCAPADSIVILTSTTRNMIKKRSWPVVRSVFYGAPGNRIGNMVESQTIWQSRKGDDKHAIFAIAVKEGNSSAAAANIQGMHAPRIFVMVDEATDCPQAIFDVCANLFSGCEDFQFVAIGNPNSKLDQFGIFTEPIDGWNNVNIDDEEWESKVKMDGKRGMVLRFDSEKSPNVIAGYKKWAHIIDPVGLAGRRSEHGPESPRYWMYDRGFYAPEGLCQTVMSETFVEKHDLKGKLVFRGGPNEMYSSVDWAFGGGDRATQLIARSGMLDNGAIGIQIEHEIPIDVNSFKKETMHYQLAEAAIANCTKYGVSPKNFAGDASGEGGGVMAILVREWSPHVVWIESNGKPSAEPVSPEDSRHCTEVYDRKVTELWYRVKQYAEAGQLKGFSTEACREFCSRTYELKNRALSIEKKMDMKNRLSGKSPDHADPIALLIELVRHRGVPLRNTKTVARQEETQKRQTKVYDEVFSELNYAANEREDSELDPDFEMV